MGQLWSCQLLNPVVQSESNEVIEMSCGGTLIFHGCGQMCKGSLSRPSSATRTGRDTQLHVEPTILILKRPREGALGSSVKP